MRSHPIPRKGPLHRCSAGCNGLLDREPFNSRLDLISSLAEWKMQSKKRLYALPGCIKDCNQKKYDKWLSVDDQPENYGGQQTGCVTRGKQLRPFHDIIAEAAAR